MKEMQQVADLILYVLSLNSIKKKKIRTGSIEPVFFDFKKRMVLKNSLLYGERSKNTENIRYLLIIRTR